MLNFYTPQARQAIKATVIGLESWSLPKPQCIMEDSNGRCENAATGYRPILCDKHYKEWIEGQGFKYGNN